MILTSEKTYPVQFDDRANLVKQPASAMDRPTIRNDWIGEDKRILVVGNELRLRVSLLPILVNCGFQVIAATSGTEAILHYHEKSFPVVMTDIALADMTGIELLKGIKSLDQEAQVIVMTWYASLDTVLEALRFGAHDYLVKPDEDPQLILNAVHHAMRKIDFIRENDNLIQKLKQKTKELEQANALLQNLAIHDGLTGLYNHRFFQDRLSAEINRSQRYTKPFALLFIDLDYFKTYNDINGHMEGDELLRNMAQLFQNQCRKTDIIARYGGDEFGIIMPETSKEQALAVAQQLCSRVAAHPFGGISCMPNQKISISIGCVSYPLDGATNDDLLRHADHALYKAKSKGRGQVV